MYSYYWDDGDYEEEEEEETYGFPCEICGKVLKNENGWKCHMRSRIHFDKTVHCPKCSRTFRTPSDMVKHLEQGNCVNITRTGIAQVIRSWEATSGHPNLFTTKCIGWRDDLQPTPTRSVTADNSFNGYFFECPICAAEFEKFYSLNQHLKSAAHDPESYHCSRCGLKYKLLSSLVEHFQSGKCGAMSYRTIRKLTNIAAQSFKKF